MVASVRAARARNPNTYRTPACVVIAARWLLRQRDHDFMNNLLIHRILTVHEQNGIPTVYPTTPGTCRTSLRPPLDRDFGTSIICSDRTTASRRSRRAGTAAGPRPRDADRGQALPKPRLVRRADGSGPRPATRPAGEHRRLRGQVRVPHPDPRRVVRRALRPRRPSVRATRGLPCTVDIAEHGTTG